MPRAQRRFCAAAALACAASSCALDLRVPGSEPLQIACAHDANCPVPLVCSPRALCVAPDELAAAGAPGLAITNATSLVTDESGQAATFSVALASRPAADVSIVFSSSDVGEGMVETGALVFTPDVWSVGQAVSVRGVSDCLVDGDVAYAIAPSLASEDADYAALRPPPVAVTNRDSAIAAAVLVAAPSVLQTNESGSEVVDLQVRLSCQPSADVSLSLGSLSPGEISLAPAAITLTPTSWQTGASVRLRGVVDCLVDGDQTVTIHASPATSADPAFAGLQVDDLSVVNVDDRHAGAIVSKSSLTTSEAGVAETFSVVLICPPTAAVTLPLAVDDSSEARVEPVSLVFTATDYQQPQDVVVTGLADGVGDGDITYLVRLGPAASADPAYQGLHPADVTGLNLDVDTSAARILTYSAAALEVSEAGGVASFTVRLATPPLDPVVLSVASLDASAGTITAGASLTFDSVSWNTPQAVVVTGVDDAIDDGDVVFDVEVAISTPATVDQAYTLAPSVRVSVTNRDDDVAGFTVSPTSGLLTSEAGRNATFSVALTSEPLAAVHVVVSTSDAAEASASPSELIFDAGNWSTPATVTVTSTVDGVPGDGCHAISVLLAAATSTDATYNGKKPADVTGVQSCEFVGRLFVTAATYTGALDPSFDAYCQNDAAKPASGTYKAFLAIGVTRFPGGADWLLKANAAYVRPDGTYVASADAGTRLPSTLSAALEPVAHDYWTGFAANWSTSSNCSDWTNEGSGVSGRIGSSGAASVVANTLAGCDTVQHLLCVEQ